MNFNDLNQLFNYIRNLANDNGLELSNVELVSDSAPSVPSVPAPPTPNPIHLRIMGLDNSSIQFLCGRDTPMKKVMSKYADVAGIQKSAARFRFDGQAITDNDTPASLEMVNGDTIEVYWQQIGGSDNEASTSKQSSETDWRSSENSSELMANLAITSPPKCCCHEQVLGPREFQGSYWKMRNRSSKNNEKNAVTIADMLNCGSLSDYPYVEKLFEKKGTVCIEGNIAAGKTTFINRLATKAKIFTLREPLDKWRDVNNVNLLDNMYRDPCAWSFIFQNYVMLTMMHNHLHHGEVKIIERSIGSVKNVFLRAHMRLETMDSVQVKILEHWHNFLEEHLPVQIDLMIYLRVNPEVALRRLKKRSRPEERKITIEYLRTLAELYDQWMYNGTGMKVITLNADASPKSMLKQLDRKLKKLQ